VETEVNIAQLKARLSYYLRAVRDGAEIIVKDRDTPVAKLVACKPRKPKLSVIPARGKLSDLNDLKLTRPANITMDTIMEALDWTRRDRF
jgi:prevent-host-death family protein